MTETTEAAAPPGAGDKPAAPAPPASELDPRRWLALASVMTALFMVLLDVSIVNVAIPAIRSNLAATTPTSSSSSPATASPMRCC